jgi:transcriptional regulator with XRE-family HTH domain
MNLREIRKSLNLSAEEVGKQVGVKACAVRRWETKRARPRIESITKLSKLYNLSYREIEQSCKPAKPSTRQFG